ncbi:hypothetical protein Tco_0291739 [Tanacetum coccineum]
MSNIWFSYFISLPDLDHAGGKDLRNFSICFPQLIILHHELLTVKHSAFSSKFIPPNLVLKLHPALLFASSSMNSSHIYWWKFRINHTFPAEILFLEFTFELPYQTSLSMYSRCSTVSDAIFMRKANKQ